MMSLRLLISGSKKNTNTIGEFICKNFDSTIEFDQLTFHDKFSEALESKWQKIIYRLWPGILTGKMDKLFVAQVRDFKPAVVVVFKGMEISKRSLIKIRELGVKLVNYNFDHPFIHFSRGTGNRFVAEAIPYYDLHISYSTLIAQELSKRYQVQTAVIPFGFHISEQQYVNVVAENRPEIQRVCFVGNPDQWRIEILKKLIREGIEIDVFGFGWDKFFESNQKFIIHKPRKERSFWKDPDEFWKILRQYRVQLNFFRPHNEGSHNLRTFEVPAVGGILLTPASEEQKSFFDEDQEICFYSSYEELATKCKWLLDQDKSWVDKVRARARLKSIASDYSYKRRTKDLLNLLNYTL